MADGTHWPRTWLSPAPEHSKGDHSGIMQVMLKHPSEEPLQGQDEVAVMLDFSDVVILLPMLVCVSREKRPEYDHNKKAGAMNALIRALAIMSNGPFILNLDFDHYIYNSQAMREGMCFMMDTVFAMSNSLKDSRAFTLMTDMPITTRFSVMET